MKREDFASAFPGTIAPIGELGIAFVPNPLPPRFGVTPDMQAAHESAVLALGELRAIVPSLPNPELITTPFLRREAVLSSRIEGTHTELEQLYLFEVNEPKTARRREPDDVADAREVLNYVRALQYGLDQLTKLPICHRLLKEAHRILLHGVRGRDKRPGEYRDCQNFIGRGGNISLARFVPPPPDKVQTAMDELEVYINRGREFPSLVRIAMIHYQFETIHPFADGNGRLGRLLITLLLASYGLLEEPLLYLSAYFERHRDDYNEHMWQVSRCGAWEAWTMFFLDGVQTEAADAARRARKLLQLREQTRRGIQDEGSSGNLLALVDSLFRFPAIKIPEAKKILQLTYRGAQMNVERLEQRGFLVEVTGYARNKVYVAKPIIDILQAATA